MIKLFAVAMLFAMFATAAYAADAKSPLDYTLNGIDGKPVELSKFKGQVVLVVNVASQCGNTKQYTALEEMYTKYKDKGLTVLGVPANEFGGQEPGSDEQIAEFCKSKYNVDFPMFSKVVVKGAGITPLYKHLTSKDTNPQFAGDVTWNFEKFLIGRNGQVVARFSPKTKPESDEVVKAVETELGKK